MKIRFESRFGEKECSRAGAAAAVLKYAIIVAVMCIVEIASMHVCMHGCMVQAFLFLVNLDTPVVKKLFFIITIGVAISIEKMPSL